MPLALLPVLGGCGVPTGPAPISFVVDLRQQDEEGVVSVSMEIRDVAPGRPIPLTSFVQPGALRLDRLEAGQDGKALSVETGRDDREFARYVVSAPLGAGPVMLRYVVRPGALEEEEMSGPTGHRFGWLDRTFGLIGGRQVFILPMDPSPPTALDVRFLAPPGWTVAAPWPEEGGAFVLRGGEAAADVILATLGAGGIETAGAGAPGAAQDGDRGLRLLMLPGLSPAVRKDSARRVRALERYLADLLGRPAPSYLMLLAPPAPDGTLLSVAPGPRSFGLSIREGVPTRWLSIGRALADAFVAARTRGNRLPDSERWLVESLPTYLAAGLSGEDGWRSRQDWLEVFYFGSAGLAIDLKRPGHVGDAPDPLMRQWRGALVLAALSDEMSRAGHGTLEDRLRAAAVRGGPIDLGRTLLAGLPEDARARLDRWLAATPHPMPFPGEGAGLTTVPAPPAIDATSTPPRAQATARSGFGRRVDLYLGGRNLGLLEQCGCRSRQAGGLARRATLLGSRLKGQTPALAFELGDAVPFDQHAPALDRQKLAESDLVLDLHARSGEAASVISHAELTYGPDYLRERAARLRPGFNLLSANVSAPGVSLPASLERAIGGVNIRVIGLYDPRSYHFGRALEHEDALAGFRIEDPVAALRRVAGRPPAGGDGLTIVAGSIGPTTVLGIHRALPDLAILVTDDYFHFTQDPRFVFERPLEGALSTIGLLDRTLIVLLQTDAYAMARVGLQVDGRGKVLAAEVEDLVLDESIPDEPAVRARLDAHYIRLAADSGLAEPAPVGTRLAGRTAASYAGAAACAPCHPRETEQWKETPHASAFATLLAKRRQGVPGCYACHVTGYRQRTGYRTSSDRDLRDVQCESCHGPGSKHAADPRTHNIVREPPASTCFECHTDTHSDMDDRNFERYRDRIVHSTATDHPEGRPATTGGSRRPG